MKQTNNAIKFLVAQYRAIFKAAYLKGLIGAALVTASVGVSAAAQEAPAAQNINLTGTIAITEDGTKYTINGGAAQKPGNGVAIHSYTGDGKKYYGFTLSGNNLTFNDAIFNVVSTDHAGYGARVVFNSGSYTFTGSNNRFAQMVTIDAGDGKQITSEAPIIAFKSSEGTTASVNIAGNFTISRNSAISQSANDIKASKLDFSDVTINLHSGKEGTQDIPGGLIIDHDITVGDMNFKDNTNILLYKDRWKSLGGKDDKLTDGKTDKIIAIDEEKTVSFNGNHLLSAGKGLDTEDSRMSLTFAKAEAATGTSSVLSQNKTANVKISKSGSLAISRDLTIGNGVNFTNNGTLTINSGSSLIVGSQSEAVSALTTTTSVATLEANSKLNNQGEIKVNKSGNLSVDVNSLNPTSYVDQLNDKYYFVNFADLGKVTNSGTITFKQATQFADQVPGENIGVIVDKWEDLGLNNDKAKVSLNKTDLNFKKNLELDSGSAAQISGDGKSDISVQAPSIKLTTDGTKFNQNYKLVADNFTFHQEQPAKGVVTVSGGKYVANKYVNISANQGQTANTLNISGATLILSNYSTEADNAFVGKVNVDLEITGQYSELLVEDRPWKAKNITLSASGSLSVEKGSGFGSLELNTLTIDGTDAKAKIESDGALTANKINLTNGSLTVNNSSLTIKGDGKTDSVDLIGGDKISLTNAKVDLSKADDTIGLAFNEDGSLKAGESYEQVTALNTNFTVDLSGLNSNGKTLSIAEANKLAGLIATGSNNFVTINGSLQPTLPVNGSNVSFEEIANNGNLSLNFDTEQSQNATLTGVTGSVTGGWKAVQVSAGQTNLEVGAGGTLKVYGSSNKGNLVEDASGNLVTVNAASGSNLVINSTGDIGAIEGVEATLTLNQGSNLSVKTNDKTAKANVTVKELTGNGALSAAEISATNINLGEGAKLDATSISVSGDSSLAANTQVNTQTFSATSNLTSTGANITANEVSLGKATIAGGQINVEAAAKGRANQGTLSATSLSLDSGAAVNTVNANVGSLNVYGGSNLVAETLALNGNGEIRVGTEGEKSSTGSISVNALQLGNGSLIIDPDFNQKTATVFASSFKTPVARALTADDLTLSGNIVVGKNSAFGFGQSEADFQAALAKRQVNGSLSADGVGAYVYLDQAITINGKKLIIGTKAINDLTKILTSQPHANTAIYIGAGSAIEVTDKAFAEAKDNKKTVINVAGSATNLVAKKGSTVYVPTTFAGTDIKTLISGASFVTEIGNKLTLTTRNGAFYYEVQNDAQLQGTEALKRHTNEKALKDILSNVSNTAGDLYRTMAEAAQNGASYTEKAYDEAIKAGQEIKDYNGMTVISDANGTMFIESSFNGQDLAHVVNVDRVARLAAIGATAQVANSAAQSTIDAVSGRLGMGNSENKLTLANNGQGAAMWVSPIYRNSEIDSFAAQGINYGTEYDFFGAAIGADYTVANGVRFGGALNFGSGDADGKGFANGVKNDFSYFGAALYAGFNVMENFTVSADISYTQVDNDLEFESGMQDYGKIKGSTDSSALSLGINAQYTFKGNVVDVAPHIGARFTRLDVDNFDVKDGNGDVIANNDANSLNYFSLPLGVSVSKDIVNTDWTIRPAFDFTVTLNAGDKDLDGKTRFDGILGYDMKHSTEIMDNFTYGASAGISGTNGAFSFGLNLGYTGSSETSEYGIGANARFVF